MADAPMISCATQVGQYTEGLTEVSGVAAAPCPGHVWDCSLIEEIVESDIEQDDDEAAESAKRIAIQIGIQYAKAVRRPHVELAAFVEEDGGVNLVIHAFGTGRRLTFDIRPDGQVSSSTRIGESNRVEPIHPYRDSDELEKWLCDAL